MEPRADPGNFSRAWYGAPIARFLDSSGDEVLGRLAASTSFSVELSQRDAWTREIEILQKVLGAYRDRGQVYLEFVVPRLGKRIDALLLLDQTIFVVEFKIGEKSFGRTDVEQVWDYALDLKNFHESSHSRSIVPILVITGARGKRVPLQPIRHADGVFEPIQLSADELEFAIGGVLDAPAIDRIDADEWEVGRYQPTPTIVEAAAALFSGHTVAEIARSDAGSLNLTKTSEAVCRVIEDSRAANRKSICLVTGVPGAGKTLVGLDVAARHMDADSGLHSVYLSGNGPLVAILTEALARDRLHRAKVAGRKERKGAARQAAKTLIQAVHHFRDECLRDGGPPPEHVAIFDEAQRAWNAEKTADFMSRKKGRSGFELSEPAFLISCLDRHSDWAVVVCLIGGGQEINTGEAGISEWLHAIETSYPDWHVHVSPRLHDDEYAAGEQLDRMRNRSAVHFNEDLHLAVSMRSFRAEHVSSFVKRVLDLDLTHAAELYAELSPRYPIVLTRDLNLARRWLRQQARGSERFGIVVSSQAQRLKPHAIDVRSPMDPVNWFLSERDDVRSSFYLEDVATEFHVQGLELDWTCVVWDADFRFAGDAWQHHSFVGSRWQHIRKAERQTYLKNAYRVLLTRARQGMVIVVPEGSTDDPTRSREFYDGTFNYLRRVGLPLI